MRVKNLIMFLRAGVIRLLTAFLVMRKPAEWMELPVDERILELLADSGPLQPKPITEEFEKRTSNVRYHRNTIGRRCRALEEHGFLISTGQGVYSITDRGRDYLAGEIDAGELENSATE